MGRKDTETKKGNRYGSRTESGPATSFHGEQQVNATCGGEPTAEGNALDERLTSRVQTEHSCRLEAADIVLEPPINDESLRLDEGEREGR